MYSVNGTTGVSLQVRPLDPLSDIALCCHFNSRTICAVCVTVFVDCLLFSRSEIEQYLDLSAISWVSYPLFFYTKGKCLVLQHRIEKSTFRKNFILNLNTNLPAYFFYFLSRSKFKLPVINQ